MRTVGAVTVEPGRYVVQAEPHVTIRLKRVFGKLGRAASEKYFLSDTEENATELLWFMERFPLDVDEAGRAHLERRAAAQRQREDEIEAMIAGASAPPEFELAVPAREYQRLAAQMALTSRGLLLADDVGIGKTVSAICTFAAPGTLPVLVVTLTHLPRQWKAEIERFAPKLNVHILKKGTPYDLRGRPKRNESPLFEPLLPDVIISNYHKLSGWAETLAKIVKSVVYDEVQELRHNTSVKYESAMVVSRAASLRLGLSATPIYNYGGEIYNVLEALRPGALGTKGEFSTEWCVGEYGRERIKEPRAFGSYALSTGLMLRRTRHDVGRELPPLTKVPHTIDSDPDELKRVASSATELATLILGRNAERGAAWKASEELSTVLRQATGIAKAPYVADFVRLLVESGESVVLYGWHREVYAIWMDRLRDLGPVLYTGSESANQKANAAEKFISGGTKVLIVSLRAGAGLDGLQRKCRTVVFGELDWSPGVHEQCVGRVFRDGQPDPVVAYFLVANEGSDPVVADVLGLKTQQIQGIRDPKADVVDFTETDPDKVKRLAAAYLLQRGIAPPPETPDELADALESIEDATRKAEGGA